eukprot:2010042-Prymnesium_polylepis.1
MRRILSERSSVAGQAPLRLVHARRAVAASWHPRRSGAGSAASVTATTRDGTGRLSTATSSICARRRHGQAAVQQHAQPGSAPPFVPTATSTESSCHNACHEAQACAHQPPMSSTSVG